MKIECAISPLDSGSHGFDSLKKKDSVKERRCLHVYVTKRSRSVTNRDPAINLVDRSVECEEESSKGVFGIHPEILLTHIENALGTYCSWLILHSGEL
jgi:hypothetical protein